MFLSLATNWNFDMQSLLHTDFTIMSNSHLIQCHFWKVKNIPHNLYTWINNPRVITNASIHCTIIMICRSGVLILQPKFPSDIIYKAAVYPYHIILLHLVLLFVFESCCSQHNCILWYKWVIIGNQMCISHDTVKSFCLEAVNISACQLYVNESWCVGSYVNVLSVYFSYNTCCSCKPKSVTLQW